MESEKGHMHIEKKNPDQSCLPDIENLDELMMISITFCVGWEFNHLLEVWPELTAWGQWKLANSHIPTAEAEGIENNYDDWWNTLEILIERFSF